MKRNVSVSSGSSLDTFGRIFGHTEESAGKNENAGFYEGTVKHTMLA